MKQKCIEYEIALINSRGQISKTVKGFALDMVPRVCVRQESTSCWVVDDYDTGFGVIRSFRFHSTKKSAITWVETEMMKLVKSGAYAEKQKAAIEIMQAGGLLKKGGSA